jgi:hypothetical protein
VRKYLEGKNQSSPRITCGDIFVSTHIQKCYTSMIYLNTGIKTKVQNENGMIRGSQVVRFIKTGYVRIYTPPFHNISLFSKLKQLAKKAYIMEQRKYLVKCVLCSLA